MFVPFKLEKYIYLIVGLDVEGKIKLQNIKIKGVINE